MKNVLVTGNKGFIGKRLEEKLKSLGYSVVGIDDEYLQNEDWVTELKNILDTVKPGFVFHVGACSDTLETDSNFMMVRNYQTTKVISDWCHEHIAILVYSSSAANYGDNGLYPSNLYGWSKYIAEDYCLKKNNCIALRYFNVYGPGESHKGRMASVAYNSFVKNKQNISVKLFPKNPKRDFVYIEDIVNANIFAMQNHVFIPKFNYYEVGSGIARSFEDVLNNLSIPFSYTDENEIPNGYQFYTCSDSNKWMPDWKPEFDLEKGIKDYLIFLEKTYVN